MVSVEGSARLRTFALVLVLAVAAHPLPVGADGHVPLQVYETVHGDDRSFGRSVAWHGDSLVVGAPTDNVVRVLRLEDGLWRVAQTLEGPKNGGFGTALAVHGDLLVVGADSENTDGSGDGAAHVYRHGGTSWKHVARLTPGDSGSFGFGFSVDVHGDWVVVGAPDAVFGGSSVTYRPSVHLFKVLSGSVEHKQTLRLDSLVDQQWFGYGVDLHGSRLLVGSLGAFQQERIDDGGAYLYVRSGNSWTREATFGAGPLQDGGGFGSAVALTDNEAVVCDDASLYITDDERALYVYRRSGSSWSLSQTLHDVSCTEVVNDGARMVTSGLLRPYLRVYGPSGSKWSQQDVEADTRPTALALGPLAVALGQSSTYSGGHVHLLGRNVAPTAVIAPVEAPRDLDGDGVEPVTLDGSGSHGGDGDAITHSWYDADDRLLGGGPKLTLDLPVGTHRLRLAVSDGALGTDVARLELRVLPPPPPAADFTWVAGDATVDDAFRFVDESTSEYGHVVSWAWDMDGDGDADANGPTPTWTFKTSGRHDVTLTVRTDIDTEASATKRVSVRNLAPDAHAGMDQILHDDGDGSETVRLDGSASRDRDGKLRSHSWVLDGRRFSSSQTPSITLGLGVHDIDLTVEDDQGARDTDRVTILILDKDNASGGNNTAGSTTGTAPDAAFSWKPHPGPPAHAAAFRDASSDREGRVVMWWYDVGADGSYEATEPHPVLSMGGYGARDVRLTVTDEDGRQSKTSRNVFLKNEAPTALPEARATDAFVGQVVVFVDNSTDPENALTDRAWDFGDGATSTEQAPTHAYAAPGTYTVRLTVTDDGGKTATASLEVTVREVPPGVTVPAVAGSPFLQQADDSPFADEEPLVDTDGDGRPDAPAGQTDDAGTQADRFQATTEDRGPGPVAKLVDPDRPWLWLGVLLVALTLVTVLWMAVRR